MTGPRMRPTFIVGLLLGFLAISLQGVQSGEQPVPSEDQCRPYIEKALKDLGTGSLEQTSAEVGTEVDQQSQEETTSTSEETDKPTDDVSKEEGPLEEVEESKETIEEQLDTSEEITEKEGKEEDEEPTTMESAEISAVQDEDAEKTESASDEVIAEDSDQDEEKVEKDTKSDEDKSEIADSNIQNEEQGESKESTEEVEAESQEGVQDTQQVSAETSAEEKTNTEGKAVEESTEVSDENVEEEKKSQEAAEIPAEQIKSEKEAPKFAEKPVDSIEDEETKSTEEATDSDEVKSKCRENDTKCKESAEQENREQIGVESKEEEDTRSAEEKSVRKDEDVKSRGRREVSNKEETDESTEEENASEEEPTPEEDLIQEIEIPENLRPRDHINQLLKLDEENEGQERAVQREADIILRDLKRLYDSAIQPLESMYKYRDLSNRHFGDPEIFSKPLVLFMGPWSGGKSSIINYLLDIEYKPMSLRTGGLRECLEERCKSPNGNDTGAEPSPAYFNIIMHGEEEEVLDGTQLAADWTFSGLQKFGQGLLDRLRGLKLKNKLLEKVNIIEIPGILEIRKQVQRLFPFNDACQWFIDRADIIFLVYDPAKLDVGPETEAILDQLKGREYQTRIILNKADQVKPEELMRVQGALIWNISPLMSSAEPPIMYSASLWSLPYETGAPTRLLYAQERAFLRDLRSAINKRVEHKIASARRFAVRVRNHAKMVDCYLTTYYNHKTFFGNKKETSDKIIENPQDYHIYEGLSTLTNISRYDLPDPDVYRDFFRLNSLYNFQLLSSTCTYFRGCPINRLDVAIAYDLPELVGKYKKSVEAVLHKSEDNSPPS